MGLDNGLQYNFFQNLLLILMNYLILNLFINKLFLVRVNKTIIKLCIYIVKLSIFFIKYRFKILLNFPILIIIENYFLLKI